MATYREAVYMVLDELKMMSDDSYFEEGHVIFLINKFRALILKQRYSDLKKDIPDSNKQELCIPLEKVNVVDTDCERKLLKSVNKVPQPLLLVTQEYNTRLSSCDNYWAGEISYVNRERFKYVGHNKWLKNFIYGAIDNQDYLYLKSGNPEFLYLDKVTMTSIFENPIDVINVNCNGQCDILDEVFPLEERLIVSVIELCVKELSLSYVYPKDMTNDSNDTMSLAQQEPINNNNLKQTLS